MYCRSVTFKRPSKPEARELVRRLVERYEAQAPTFRNATSDFSEADTRNQFLDPLLQALGWDLANESGLPSSLMEVVLERTSVDGEPGLGRPDYRLRMGGTDVIPVEAKKPNVPVGKHPRSTAQARRYGWSLSLPAAVLSNFDELIVFDTTIEPMEDDEAHVAVRPDGYFSHRDYVERFDDLWHLLSYESLSTDGLEGVYRYERPPRGESPFDARFLAAFREWRTELACDVAAENRDLGEGEVGRRVQRILNALLFLRICEDRNISRYEDLLRSANSKTIINAFKNADRAFNAGLFTVLNETSVSSEALAGVVRDMYWPQSQFAFGVMQPEILAGVYEQYLAEQVTLDEHRNVRVEEKPEIAHSGGVVSTPDYIVKEIGAATLDPQLANGVPKNLAVLDMAVGSGIFLLDAFERLVTTVEAEKGHLGLVERAELATSHIFGVDIDGAAVEVARLSLLLAILGDDGLDLTNAFGALPDLSRNIVWGNSIVREDFDEINPYAAADIKLRARAKPLNLQAAFGPKYPRKGFTAVIGNPPYIRIQVLSEYFPETLAYLQSENSSYESSRSHNFDVYMVFVERALDLLSKDGRLGVIIPQRFTNLLAASPIRRLLSRRIERLIHFGVEQVFPGRTTYTAIAIAGQPSKEGVQLELVNSLGAWRKDRIADVSTIDRSKFTADQWPIATTDQNALFDQLRNAAIAELGEANWVHIFVGVQTSADDFYFIHPTAAGDDQIATFVDCTGTPSTIERALLRPAILDQSIGFYGDQPASDTQVIFPYRSYGKTPKERLISPKEMREQFPHADAYFRRHRERLERRKVSPDPGEAFWAYGRSQSITLMDDPKLIVRVLSLTPQYALDDEGLVVPGGGDGGPYYLLRPRPTCPYSIDVIQAILSHPIVDLFVAVTGKKYRGSYASHRKAFLEKVPVPNLSTNDQSEIEFNVKQLRRLSCAMLSETDTEQLRSIKERHRYLAEQIEATISAAYKLDQNLVDRVSGKLS